MKEYNKDCYDEWIVDEHQVQFWNDEAYDDPIYALLINKETWNIVSMKTVLEWGL